MTIDANNPPVHYNTKVTAAAGTIQKITDYTYDRARKWYYPISTSSYTKNTATGTQSTVATSTTNYNDYAQVTTTTDPEGGRTEYGYNATTHWLETATTAITATQKQFAKYDRNTEGTVTKVTIRENDAAGKLLQQVENQSIDDYGNALITVAFDGTRNLTTTWEYGASSGFAFKQEFEFDKSSGKLTRYIDGKDLPTVYEYDDSNRLTKATHPDNSSIQIKYDDFNNIVTTIDETGITSITKYNPLGWKVETGLVENGIYKAKGKFGYTVYGQMEWSEDAIGNRTEYRYDAWGRQTELNAPDESKTTVVYDDIARTKVATDPEQVKVKETFDKNGRVVTQEEFLSGRTVSIGYTYDQAGQVRSLKDGNNNTTTYGYDAMGQLTSVIQPVQAGVQEETKYEYNLVGQLKQVMYADGKTLKKVYDERGRLVKTIDSNEAVMEQYAYDANGNKAKHIDKKGQEFTYTYHPTRDWLTDRDVTGKSEETVSYTYDAAGRRISMTYKGNTTSYQYNSSNGMLEQVTYPDNRTISYDYDAVGNRRQTTDPFGGNVYYRYNNLNQLWQVGPSVEDADAEYTYYKNGLLQLIEEHNGIKSIYDYDGSRLESLEHQKADGTLLNRYTYTTDGNGNIETRGTNGVSHSFTYDKLNRIVTSGQKNEVYTYDKRGNRQTMQAVDPSESPDGTFTYNSRDQLEGVTSNGNQVTYTYDGDGLLWERTENGETTRYYYDGAEVIAEATVINGVSTLKARYIRGNGLIAREDTSGQKLYYLHNGHGDVVELRDTTGNTRLNQYDYDIWGNLLVESEQVAQPFKYSGEMFDSTTKLQYLRARWYDPSMGRFMNKDSYEGDITNPLSLNLYTYVGNNSLIYIDPTGHMMEIDNNIAPLYNQGDRNDLLKYTQQFINATNDYERQASHDAANAVRLKYVNSIERIDFVNGGSTTLFPRLVVNNGDSSSVVQPYFKAEAGAGLIVGGSLELKAQDGKFSLSFKVSTGGIGASASASVGVELVASEGDTGASAGIKVGALYFAEVAGTVTTDVPGLKANAGAGVGIGVEVRLPLSSINPKLEGEYNIFTLTFTNGDVGPAAPTVRQWNYMLDGNSW